MQKNNKGLMLVHIVIVGKISKTIRDCLIEIKNPRNSIETIISQNYYLFTQIRAHMYRTGKKNIDKSTYYLDGT